MIKDITQLKRAKMLLEDKWKLMANSEVSKLVTFGHGNQNTEMGSCRYCGKSSYKKNFCWKNDLELILNGYKSEQKESPPTPPKKALSVSKRWII